MAGSNLILKPGQLLFKKGDPATGLYIVRKGELQVYIEEAGKEFSLASIPGGSVIGEMAVFDNNARSASVKAKVASEVTFISREEFTKMSGQIPNWFNSVIKTLSIRLRVSNDRLQRYELDFNMGTQRLLAIQRILSVLDMLWYREAEKAEKEWFLDILTAKQTLTKDFCEDPALVDRVCQALLKQEIYGQKRNSLNRECFAAPNRGALTRILVCMRYYTSHRPTAPLNSAVIAMLLALRQFGESSAYDVLTPSLQELMDLAKGQDAPGVESWAQHVQSLTLVSNEIKVSKDDKDKWQLKLRKKDLKDIVVCHLLIQAIFPEA